MLNRAVRTESIKGISILMIARENVRETQSVGELFCLIIITVIHYFVIHGQKERDSDNEKDFYEYPFEGHP